MQLRALARLAEHLANHTSQHPDKPSVSLPVTINSISTRPGGVFLYVREQSDLAFVDDLLSIELDPKSAKLLHGALSTHLAMQEG